MEFLKHTLKNGLDIVVERNDEAHSAAVGFFVNAGSRDENDAVSGVSHFLEHMTFKGTPTRSAEDVNREFDEMGAHYNAFTNEENTVYYAAVLPERQTAAVELLADILRPSLREDDFNMEKQVILEEIKMYEDQPPFGADEKVREAFFGNHPLGRSVLGTHESIQALEVGRMREYFARRYAPNNIILAASGKIDFDELIRVVESRCGAWTPSETPREVGPAKSHDGFLTLTRDSASQQYAMLLSPGPSADAADRYAAKLLSVIVGDDSGSRFFWEMLDPGLAEQASLSHCEFHGAGLMMTYMSCDPQFAEKNLQIIQNIFKKVQAEGVTAEEVEQAKSKIRSRVVLSGERPRSRLFSIGGDWVYRQEYRSLKDDLDEIALLGVGEVNTVVAKYPLAQGMTMTVGPMKKVKKPK